jgi:hypothetical protein
MLIDNPYFFISERTKSPKTANIFIAISIPPPPEILEKITK